MDFKHIVDLAKNVNKSPDEFNTANLSEEIKQALTEVMAEEKAVTVKAAAREIINIINESLTKESKIVEEIRALRRKEAELKVALAKINKAREYAVVTNNYIPLALASGNQIPNHYRALYPELMEVKPIV